MKDEKISRFVFFLVQWTWGLPQNLLGALLYLILSGNDKYRFRRAYVRQWNNSDCMSLGLFIFVHENCSERILRHEYGHTIQSFYLGPFYLLFIGIPSFLWANLPFAGVYRRNRKVSYYSFYSERWADRLGQADRKEVL